MTDPAPPLPKAAYAGALLGVCGWVPGLAGLCLAHGRFDLLWSLALPSLCASLALGLLLVVAHRMAVCAHGPRARAPGLVLVGGLLTVLGVLLLLVETWVMPALAADLGMRASLEALGSTLSVPKFVPVLALVGGAGLQIVSLRNAGPPSSTRQT